MINIKISDNSIEIDGHSGYGARGQDIVCSAVSTTFFVLKSLLDELEISYEFEAKSGHGKIKANSCSTYERAIFNSAYKTLKILEKSYSKNIKIADIRATD